MKKIRVRLFTVLMAVSAGMLSQSAHAAPGDGSPSDANMQYIGRWDKSNSTVYHGYWGGSYVKAQFTGTTVKIKLARPVNISVSIDGGSEVNYDSANGTVNLTPTPLPSGTHTVRVANQYEDYDDGSPTDLAFQGFVLDAGATTQPANETKDVIEFIGDSITSGNGNSNGALSAFAWVTGELLRCDHTQISHSSITLVEGYSDLDGGVGMTSQYGKLWPRGYTATPAAPDWNFANYTPKVVVVNLGANDYGSVPNATFQSSYIAFLQTIRAAFPNAEIFAMLEPADQDDGWTGYYPQELQNAVANRNSAGDAKVHYIDSTLWVHAGDFQPGDLHPTDSGHVKIAQRLAPILQPFVTCNSAPPAPVLATPANGATGVAANPTLAWNASTGATSYRLQVSTSATFTSTVVDQSNITASSYAVTGLAGGTPYYWRVNASNGGGTSGYSAVFSFTTAGSATLITVNDSTTGTGTNQFRYSGNWTKVTASGAYRKDEHRAQYPTDTIQISFTGTQIKLYGSKGNNRGRLSVAIDGGPATTVDTYNASTVVQQLVYTSSPLPAGPHTLTITCLGTRSANSSDEFVYVDYVVITP